ncbi:thiamine pyrophosphate-binding protein [Pantoea sp. 18069]|uniref:thiamine pyrophosphate-binding protein n=1 Tax=Pantoea sp. 18069 TaxID=2681415 RepID=UPI0013577507|nr:thiamine pyrophosphate-binding protein [Pantoea sp. 18069]
MSEQQINGGALLVQALQSNQVDTVYCVPGESYLPVLDALYEHPGMKTIVSKHEGAASNMADAYGKLTGRPGIVFVTRGPGATHASNGVHTAMQDSTPMILFIGQVGSDVKEREAFQEINYRSMFGDVAKWATEIDSIERIPEIVNRAFSVAMSGRKGPVVIGLPEDVLFGMTQALPALAPAKTVEAAPCALALQALQEELQQARRPLVVVGGTGWTEQASADLQRFVQAHQLPVAAGFRRQDILDNRDPHYVGQLGLGISPALAETVQQADLLIVVGSRLSEVTSGAYALIRSPRPAQRLVHAHADAQELNRVFQCDVPVQAGVAAMAQALARLPVPGQIAGRETWLQEARKNYEQHNTPLPRQPQQTGVSLAHVMGYLNQHLPEDAILTNGAGNYTVWLHRFYQYKKLATELAPTNGAMGYGLPAAIAAKLHAPERTVVCFAGDGCFLMYPQELATAKQFGANVIVIVVNNGMYGTIRMHQEREFPGRVSATDLEGPDFVLLAQAFGAHGERVETDDAFAPAFERAMASGKPALIELRTDPAQIGPQARLAA